MSRFCIVVLVSVLVQTTFCNVETVAKDTPLVNEKGNENEELETPVENVQSFANEVKATDETCAKVGEFVSFGFYF